jgi:hypothetical protein
MLKKQLILLKKHGVKNFLFSKYKKLQFVFKLLIHFPTNDGVKWSDLKDKYKGQRVFLIGNGPSLNKTPLYLLQGEKIMCFNRFHLMLERVNWKPKFHTIVDNLVLDDLLDEFDKVTQNSENVFIPAVHPQGDVFIKRVKDSSNICWFRNKVLGSGFSTNLPHVYGGGSVIHEGFQILKHMGFSEIILLGVDMNYQIHKSVKSLDKRTNNIQSLSDDDPNHFDLRYFGKGKKYHQPEHYIVQNILNSLENISKISKTLNLKIINAGFDSKVEFFQRKNIYDVLNLTKNQTLKIFEDCITSKTKYKSFKELEQISYLSSKKNYTQFEININYFTELEFGALVVKKSVYTHLCLGPFNDKFYFVSRLNLAS